MLAHRGDVSVGSQSGRNGGRGVCNRWLLSALLLAVAGIVHAGILDGIVSHQSGKVARFQYELRDRFFISALAWSPDGRYLATSSAFGINVHVWDMRTRRLVKELGLPVGGNSGGLSWSPDGQYLAACGGPNGVLLVYAASDWSEAHRFSVEDTSGCTRAEFSGDGQQLAVLAKRLGVFSVGSWTRIASVDGVNGWIRPYLFNTLAYIPGTHTFLLAGQIYRVAHGSSQQAAVGVVRFVAADDLQPAQEIQAYRAYGDHGGAAQVISLAVSSDGRQVSTGAATGNGSPPNVVTESVHVYNLVDGSLTGAPLDGLDFGKQTALAYTADGRYLLTSHEGAEHSAIHLIDARTLRVADLIQVSGAIYGIAPDPKSACFAASANATIKVWCW